MVESRHRDIFPLPSCLPREWPRQSGFCRKVRRRLERASHVDAMVEECIEGLNAMYSHGPVVPAMPCAHGTSASQQEVVKHIRHSVHALGRCPDDLDGPGAVAQLRAFDGYGEDQCPASMATYVPELLSLPSKGNKSMPLAELLGDDGGLIVSEFIRSRLLDKNEARSNLVECGVRQCFSDPKLRDPRVFSGFVKRLAEADLVDFSLTAGVEKVEAFFVKKKDHRIRMVVDCRRSNAWFAPPDKVRLCTAEALSRIMLEDTGSLFIATADLKDAFYHFELPEQLRDYFSMRPVFAGEVGVEMVGDVSVAPSTRIFPRLKVLPMGWSHALWWCQSIHQRIVARAGAVASNCVEDKAAIPSGHCMHLEYVDNFVVIGTDQDAVENMAVKGVAELRKSGLVVHEEESGSGQVAVLGWQFDGTVFRPKSMRVWRVRMAFKHLLQIGSVSGRQLEKVVGHATFLCLGRRECLSIFGETYTFIRQHYHSPHRIWKSVRRELQIFISITPLIWRNLAATWDSEVVAVDASTWGLGATSCEFSSSEVSELGRFSERWRFNSDQHYKPRASAFGAEVASMSQDGGAAIWASQQVEARGSRQPLRVTEAKQASDVFVQVPFETMNKQWKVCGRYRWKRVEAIPVLEARASLFAVKHALRRVSSFNKRHLILSDSISAVCALEKGRGRAFKMRRVSQQIGALVIGSNTSFSYRWIPSEWNVSDGPSRGSNFPSKASRLSKRDDSSALASGATNEMSRCPSETKEVIVSNCDPHVQVQEGEPRRDSQQEADVGRSGITAGGFSGGGLPSPVCRELEEDGASPWKEVRSLHSSIGGRRGAGRDVGVHVRGGRRLECRPIHDGGHTFQAASPEINQTINATTESTVDAGMEKDGPSKIEASFTMGGHVPHHHALPKAPASSSGSDDCNMLRLVPQTWGSDEAKRHGPCETGGDKQEGEESLGSGASSSRGGDQQQDRRVRRDSHVRSRGAQVPSSSHLSAEECGKQQPTQPYLQSDLSTIEENYGRSRKGPEPRMLGSHSPISPPTRGGVKGLRIEAASAGGDTKKREVAFFRKCQTLRERRQAPAASTTSAPKHTGSGRKGYQRRRACLPQPALSPGRALSCMVFIEIFSGVGNLAAAVAKHTVWPVLVWDICLGAEYDLRSPAKRHLISNWIKSGWIAGLHLGTPCESFSRARDVPPGPPPLRSNERPMGLDCLRPADQIKVTIGNMFMRFSAFLLSLCLRLGALATMENPQRSRIWLCPPIAAIIRKRQVSWNITHYCAWGKPFKKATVFLAIHVALNRLCNGVCHSSKRGICQHTGGHHIQLCGRNSQGQWNTKVAEPYPPKMCVAIARDFSDFFVARIANNFSKHLV